MTISYGQLVSDHRDIELLAKRLKRDLDPLAATDADRLRQHLDDLLALITDHINMERELASQIEREEKTFYWGKSWHNVRQFSDDLHAKIKTLSCEWQIRSIIENRGGFEVAIKQFFDKIRKSSSDEIGVFYRVALEKGLIPLR